jgi:hypothetical protein
MVCSRQPRSFQGVDRTDGQMDDRMDDERKDGNIYLFCLDGWTEWMMGWTTRWIQGKLHFSSPRPLQYMMMCHMFFFFLVAITMGNYNLYLGMSPRVHHLVCVFWCVHKFNLKNLSYFVSKLPHDLLVIVCGSKECTQNLLTFCNTLYKKLNSIPCDKCLRKHYVVS